MSTRMPSPRTRRIHHLAFVAATVALLPLSAGSVAAQSQTNALIDQAGVTTPVLDWQPCHADRYECATVRVPLDYDRPGGSKISLAMIRRLAPDQENRIGSLFVNPGGPGGSGLDFVKDAPGDAFDLFSRFDIVSWDTRGDGASRPVIDCTTDAQDEAARLEGLVRPATADRAELVAAARAFTRGCEKGANGLLPHMSTADTARDLDLMRAAVGDKKLTYIGLSYGTLIGATYSSLFPERVRAMVADSPVDPDGKVNRPRSNKREQAVANEFGYRRFFAACAAAGDRCGFGGANPQQAFDDLIARANKTPIPAPNAPLPTRVTGDDILIALVDLVIAKSTWPLMAAALASAEAGDASTIRQLYDAQIGPRQDGTWNPTGTYFATTAADWDTPGDVGSYLAEGRHLYTLRRTRGSPGSTTTTSITRPIAFGRKTISEDLSGIPHPRCLHS